MCEDILEVIHRRASARAPFDSNRPVAEAELGKIVEAGRWAPTAHNMQNYELVVVDDQETLKRIGKIRFPITEAFVRENYENLSFSEEEWQQKGTGLIATHFPPALRAPDTKLDETAYQAVISQTERAITASSYLVVVLYDPSRRAPDSEGDFLGIMSLGCLLENMWLMATALAVDFQVVSILGAPEAANEVRRILQVPDHLSVAFAVRLGRVPPDAGSDPKVRREIHDFTHYNLFGSKVVLQTKARPSV